MIEAKDQYGRLIKIGDVITYPGRSGSSLWMNTAVVYDITEGTRYWNNKMFPKLKVKRTQHYLWGDKIPKVSKTIITEIGRATVVDKSILTSNDKFSPLVNIVEELTQ